MGLPKKLLWLGKTIRKYGKIKPGGGKIQA